MLLPHEALGGAFLLFLWVRLVLAVGFFGRDPLLFLLFLLAEAAVVAFGAARESELRWRVRLLFFPVVMNIVYLLLRTAIPSVHPRLEDEALQAADHWLIGENLSLRLQGIVHPLLTDFLSFCYLLYFIYLLFSQAWYFFGDLGVLKKYYAGLFSLYAVGYMGYSIVPALGPYLAMADQFTVPLEGGWLTRANAEVVLKGSNRVDVFPSLHCANSLFTLLFDWRHKRWRFWLYLVPCAGFWFSTLYLRYHYLVDLLCGFALSLLAVGISRRVGAEGSRR